MNQNLIHAITSQREWRLNLLGGGAQGKGMGRPRVFLVEACVAGQRVQRGGLLRMGAEPGCWARR